MDQQLTPLHEGAQSAPVVNKKPVVRLISLLIFSAGLVCATILFIFLQQNLKPRQSITTKNTAQLSVTATPTPSIDEWITYANTIFHLQYPSDWNLIQYNQQGDEQSYTLTPKENSNTTIPSFQVTIAPASQSKSAQILGTQNFLMSAEHYEKSLTNVSNTLTLTLQGELHDTKNPVGIIQTYFWLTKNDRSIAILEQTTADNTGAEERKTLEKILASFSI